MTIKEVKELILETLHQNTQPEDMSKEDYSELLGELIDDFESMKDSTDMELEDEEEKED